MEGKLEDMLKDRGITYDIIEKMKEQKIDMVTITDMSDEDLGKYLTKLGDRCAVRRFCAKLTAESSKGKARKTSLLDKLKKKLHSHTQKDENESPSTDSEGEKTKDKRRKTLIGNRNAEKGGRTIKMGWKHFEYLQSEYVQVRSDKGGGTDDIYVPKHFKKSDLIEEAKSMFFTDGKSAKGQEDELEFDIADFKSEPLEDEITVGELFTKTKRRVLRYYLFTKPKIENRHENRKMRTNKSLRKQKSRILPDLPKEIEVEAQQESLTLSSKKGPSNTSILEASYTPLPGPSGINVQSVLVPEPEASYTPLPGPSGINMQSVLPESDNEPDLSENVGPFRTIQVTLPDGTQEDILYDIEPDDSGIIQLNFENQDIISDVIQIRVHRGHALKDLIEAFTNTIFLEYSKIKIQMVLPNGTLEQAQDEGGVSRDCITELWESFYCSCTVGKDSKVPFLRHDYGQLQWEAVGKLIKYGYQEFGYFPVCIAQPFMEYCILGEAKTDLKETFFNYVSPSEASVIKEAMKEFCNVDLDELTEILQLYDCRKMPTAENVALLIAEISHKEIIQKPMFVIDAFKIHLFQFMSATELQNLYSELIPTDKTVIQKLKFPEQLCNKEAEIKKYVQRFIRDLDKEGLGKFLRFCTGSDLLSRDILVRFTDLDGFGRRVIAHACGCTLEVPTSYENYVEFRSEFSSILNSGVWVMDIS